MNTRFFCLAGAARVAAQLSGLFRRGAVFGVGLLAAVPGAQADNTVPIPCNPCAGDLFFNGTAGSSSAAIPGGFDDILGRQVDLLIEQRQQREIFNWESFDIGSDAEVYFKQRVLDADGNPTLTKDPTKIAINMVRADVDGSQIAGILRADGQVYIINPNGVLFRAGSQVDVNTLLVSGIDFAPDLTTIQNSDDIFLLSRQQLSDGLFRAGDGVGTIDVEAGAVLRVEENGRLVLVGKSVSNAGRLEASGAGGQVMLVASGDSGAGPQDGKVWLFTDSPIGDDDALTESVRGLDVALGTSARSASGGTATNTGNISVGPGNVTLAGAIVNQNGVVRATTAVNANGSVRLLARGSAQPPAQTGAEPLQNQVDFGTVNLGAGSTTEIELTDAASDVLSDAQGFPDPLLFANAKEINVGDGARLRSVSGRIELRAQNSVVQTTEPVDTAGIGVNIGQNVVLDASGVESLVLPMSANEISFELRGNELADIPQQRDGVLRGTVVTIDARKAAPSVANFDGAFANRTRTLAERYLVGGDVVLDAFAGAVNVGEGSVIDVSGGFIDYEAGEVKTTLLQTTTGLVDIHDASADDVFLSVDGAFEINYERWGITDTFSLIPEGASGGTFEPGYREGKDAGTIVISAAETLVNGTLRGTTETGLYQRRVSPADVIRVDPRTGEMTRTLLATGAETVIDAANLAALSRRRLDASLDDTGFRRPFDELAAGARVEIRSTVQQGEATLSSATDALVLDVDSAGGSARTTLEGVSEVSLAVGDFELSAGERIDLGPAGALSVTAADTVRLSGAFVARGGTLAIVVNPDVGNTDAPEAFTQFNDAIGGLVISPGASIDLSGSVVVDPSPLLTPFPDAPVVSDGGIFLTQVVAEGPLADNAGVTFAEGARIAVDGGLYQSAGDIAVAGSGGVIGVSLSTFTQEGAVDLSVIPQAEASLLADLSGWTFSGPLTEVPAQGAGLRISTPEMDFSGSRVAALNAGEVLARAEGFHDLSLVSSERVMRLTPDLDLVVTPQQLQYTGALSTLQSGFAGDAASALSSGTAQSITPDPAIATPSSLWLRSIQTAFNEVAPDAGNAPNAPFLVAAGVRLAVSPGGTIGIRNEGSVSIDGSLVARGGNLLIAVDPLQANEDGGILAQNQTDYGYNDDLGLFLGDSARLDVRGAIFSEAVNPLTTNSDSVRRRILDGGNVSLTANTGVVLGATGARVLLGGATDAVAGTSDEFSALLSGGRAVTVATDAGQIALTSGLGIVFDAVVEGGANTALGARGAGLTVDLDAGLRPLSASTTGALAGSGGFDLPDASLEFLGGTGFQTEQLRLEIANSVSSPLLAATVGDSLSDAYNLAAVDVRGFLTDGGFDVALRVRPNAAVANLPALEEALIDDAIAFTPVFSEALVDLSAGVELTVPGRLVIDAPLIQTGDGDVVLQAAYLAAGSTEDRFIISDTDFTVDSFSNPQIESMSVSGGTGNLLLSGGEIDLIGQLSLRGLGAGSRVSVESQGDIRLAGIRRLALLESEVVGNTRTPEGSLNTLANLSLTAERIYPTSLTDYRINQLSDGGLIGLFAPGATGSVDAGASLPVRGATTLSTTSLETPLSVGANLTITADNLYQAGAVFAPLGGLSLVAEDSVVLESGSLTSVGSAGLTLPFGKTELGEYVVAYLDQSLQTDPNRTTIVYSVEPDPVLGYEKLFPEKSISVSVSDASAQIDLSSGATIDVAGGGSIFATEFSSGPQGTVDLLEPSIGSGAFAIVPVLANQVSVFDPIDTPGFPYAAGTRLQLDASGRVDLAAGQYAVLPARFALIEGAFLVTPTSDPTPAFSSSTTAFTRPDGLTQGFGKFLAPGESGVTTLSSGFTIESSAELANRAEYLRTDANTFFVEQAQTLGVTPSFLPRDAGELVVAASETLGLGATLVSGDGGGLGSRVDILANRFALGSTPTPGAVLLDPVALGALGADSLLLGARRIRDGSRITLTDGRVTPLADARADEIVVQSDTRLSLPELLLAATDRIVVEAGATIDATDRREESLALDLGAASFVGALGRGVDRVLRDSGLTGDIQMLGNLTAGGAVILDAPLGIEVDLANLGIADGADLYLGGSEFVLGQPRGGVDGIDLSRLNPDTTLGTLALRATSAIALDEGFTVNVETLSIDAPGLVRGTLTVPTELLVDTLVLANQSGSGALSAASYDGALTLRGERLLLDGTGADGFLIDGFLDLTLDFGEVASRADSELSLGADVGRTVTFDAGRISAANLSSLTLTSATDLQIGAATVLPAAVSESARLAALGGSVEIIGRAVALATGILAPGGDITVRATGGELTLNDGTLLDAAGVSGLQRGGLSVGSAGGVVQLITEVGDLQIDASDAGGVRVDVSGGRGDDVSGSGGQLNLAIGAGDLALLDTQGLALRGSADDGATQARFSLSTGGIVGAGVGELLEGIGQGAGGDGSFSGSVRLDFRGGTVGALASIDFGVGDDIRASEIRVVSEAAPIQVASRFDASGERGGTVVLTAGGDVALTDTAVIDARATGGLAKAEFLQAVAGEFDAGHTGGTFEIAALGGDITVASGARVSVEGTTVDGAGQLAPEATGRVRLVERAAGAFDAGSIGGTFTGVGTLELLDRIDRAAGDLATDTAGILADATVALAVAPSATFHASLADLGGAVVNPETVTAADFSFTAPGDLTVTAADVQALFAGGIDAGRLAIRAGGRLTLNGDLIDGRVEDPVTAVVQGGDPSISVSQIADQARSWGVGLVAGADTTSVDRLKTTDSALVSLDVNGAVATGTGDIDLVSAGDIAFGSGAYVASTGRHPSDYLGTYAKTEGAFTLATRLAGVSLPERGGDIRIAAAGDLAFADAASDASGYREFLVVVGADSSTSVAQNKRSNDSNSQDLPRAWGFVLDSIAGGTVAGLAGGTVAVDVGGILAGGNYLSASAGRQVGDVGPLGRSANAGPRENGLAVPYMAQVAGLDTPLDLTDDLYRPVVSDIVEMLGTGRIDLRAGELRDADVTLAQGSGAVTVRGDADVDPGAAGTGLRVLLGQGTLAVEAAGDIRLGSVGDPTTVAVGSSITDYYKRGSAALSADKAGAIENYAIASFLTMAETSALDLVSATGDIQLLSQAALANDFAPGLLSAVSTSVVYLFPANTRMVATVGDIDLRTSQVRFAPATETALSFVAGEDLFGQDATATSISYLEAALEDLFVDTLGERSSYELVASGTRQDSFRRPIAGVGPDGQLTLGIDPDFLPSTPMLSGDNSPLVLAADAGDLSGLTLTSAESIAVSAGRDIASVRLVAKNLSDVSVSSVVAGRDILQPTLREALSSLDGSRPRNFGAISTGGVSTQLGILVDGGGDLIVTSGRDIDLGVSLGAVSRGGLVDTRLEALDGADLTLLAGATDNSTPLALLETFTNSEQLAGALAAALGGSGAAAIDELNALGETAFVAPTVAALSAYLAELETAGVLPASTDDDLTRFATLPETYQLAFASKVFFDVVETAGREGQLAFADVATDALFPGPGAGDFSSPLSTVQTQDGGDVNLMAAYGSANTGLTSLAGIPDDFKADRDLGIIVFGEGDANAYVAQDYFVNSTRFFAQGGGSALIYAKNGNIDAGRGAKSVADIAELIPQYDRFGNFSDRPPLEVAGSGIRSTAPAGGTSGDVLLFAPGGVINAGDAGIGSDGGLVAVANQIIGADNISVAGPSSVTTNNSSVSVDTGSADVAAAATRAAGAAAEQAVQQAAENKAAEQANAPPKLAKVDVDVLSFGQ